MTPVRNLILGVALGATAFAGCGAPAAAPPAATTTSPASSTAQPSAPGTVQLTGDLRSPGPVTAQQIAGLPQHTVPVQYTSSKGAETRTETGVLVADLLPPDVLATTDRKNDLLSFAVLAVGADGYAALVSYGEVSPDFGNRGILLATAEDGTALDRPRLVVPGDVKGGRYVSDVTELRVIHAAA
jgi:hypothetical protein